jgi:hypothetical protein
MTAIHAATSRPGTRIVVCGHSHCSCLHFSVDRALAEAKDIEYLFQGLAPPEATPEGEAYWSGVVALAAASRVVLSWNGNEHNSQFLLEATPPFRVAHETFPDMNMTGDIRFVPVEAVRALYGPGIDDMSRRIAAIQAAGPESLFCLEPPPPLPDGEALRSRILREQLFMDVAARRGLDLATMPLTRFEVRASLRAVICDLRREACARLGATLVPAPAASMDEQGALLEQYWSQDATHANAAYGELVWKSLLQSGPTA